MKDPYKDKKWYINSPKHSNDFKAFIKDEKVRHAYSIVEISELLDLPTYAISYKLCNMSRWCSDA